MSHGAISTGFVAVLIMVLFDCCFAKLGQPNYGLVKLEKAGIKPKRWPLPSIKEYKRDENEALDEILEQTGQFEGDIFLTAEEKAEWMQSATSEKPRGLLVTTDVGRIWTSRGPNGAVLIPYAFAAGFSDNQRNSVRNAMEDLQNVVGNVVQFVPRVAEADYINLIRNETGCWSRIGRVGGSQHLHLANNCFEAGTLQHELLHALGFMHEHTRPDRDNFVDILSENIRIGKENNFGINGRATSSLGEGYNRRSIMHYGQRGFGKLATECFASNWTCNTVVAIRSLHAGIDGRQMCLGLSGPVADGTRIVLRPCSEQVTWQMEPHDDTSIRFRWFANQDYCLDVKQGNWDDASDGTEMRLQTCGGDFKRKRFQVHSTSNDLSLMNLRWEADNRWCVSVTPNGFPFATEGQPLATNECAVNTRPHQFAFDFYALNAHIDRVQCHNFQMWCRTIGGNMMTIDGRGNPIGSLGALQDSDIDQVRRMYRCPGGPREKIHFCTPDCPCEEGEGDCDTNDDCIGDLYCEQRDFALDVCKSSPRPTPTPTKRPTWRIITPKPFSLTPPTASFLKVPTLQPIKLYPTIPNQYFKP